MFNGSVTGPVQYQDGLQLLGAFPVLKYDQFPMRSRCKVNPPTTSTVA